MTTEELRRIGDAAWEAVHDHGAFRRDFRDDAYLEDVGAAVLAAVKAHAHTPTEDERDCLTLIARDVHLYDGGESAAITGPHARRIAEAAIAVGFHRSEVPEPPSEADLALRGLEALPASDPRAQARNGAVPKPQGEPSDVQVRAAMESWYGVKAMWSTNAEKSMRAALRAAWSAR